MRPAACTSLFRLALRRALAAVLIAGAAGGALACPAAPGQTCAPAGSAPASQPLGVAVNLGAGNPINVINGNKYQREEDMPALPGVMGLEIVRHYNSALSGPQDWTGRVGRGWRLSYETRLVATAHTIEVLQADGARLLFSRDALRPALATPDDPAHGVVTVRRGGAGDEYLWRWADGRELSFNHQGQLMQIKAATGEITSLLYDPKGPLVRVTDPQGRSLSLGYLDRKDGVRGDRYRGVQSIQSPVGRFSYEYGSAAPQGMTGERRTLIANLVRVRYPADGQGRQYHYEDARHPSFLTGISIEGAGADGKPQAQRYATFGYDATGKGVLSTHANDIDKVTLDFSQNGATVITNSLGQKTTYRYAGADSNYRLTEVRGAGCALCGTPNQRYRYDKLGRLVETLQLDAAGMPLESSVSERDYMGRVVSVSRVAYRQGKAIQPRLLARYEYGTGLNPILIARPSVVPGREFITRIEYAADGVSRGLPVSISESGYRPGFGSDESLHMLRRVHYRYDARGRMIESDGPLANAKVQPGPENSDISRNEYDPAHGLLRRIVEPGGVSTEILARDAALRPTRIRRSDGYVEQVATIRNNWRGQPEEVSVTASRYTDVQSGRQLRADTRMTRTQSYHYDAQGHLLRVTRPGNLTTGYQYDPAGRLTHTILPDGSRVVIRSDSEGRPASEQRFSGGDAAPALSANRFHYDDANRLDEVSDTLGVRHRAAYTDRGQLERMNNALDIASRFFYDEQGRLVGRVDAAGSADAASVRMAYDGQGNATTVTDAKGVATERRYDDFGNKVIEASADRGAALFVYDAADRLVARIDQTGGATRYRYDHAGRLLGVGVDNAPDFRLHRYRGQQLAETISTLDGKIEHAVERTEYQRDSFGQVVREQRWRARAGASAVQGGAAAGLSFVTTSSYDVAGRLLSQILPDGHRLQYRYAGSRAAVAAGSRPGQLLAILFDEQVIVAGIEQTIAGGLSAYVNGNGVRQRIGFDERGRVQELAASVPGARPKSAGDGWWARWQARFAGSPPAGETIIYRQRNAYDMADRLRGIKREQGGRQDAAGLVVWNERYDYDDMNRLISFSNGVGGTTSLRYDRAGNRVEETLRASNAPVLLKTAFVGTKPEGAASAHRAYRYSAGSNRLLGISRGPVLAAQSQDAALDGVAWLYHATGIPLAQLTFGDTRSRGIDLRVVYNAARRPVAVYDRQQRPFARYHYNAQGERVGKTSYDGHGKASTRYSLYQQQRLSAESEVYCQ